MLRVTALARTARFEAGKHNEDDHDEDGDEDEDADHATALLLYSLNH
jgi:hypothetical protein